METSHYFTRNQNDVLILARDKIWKLFKGRNKIKVRIFIQYRLIYLIVSTEIDSNRRYAERDFGNYFTLILLENLHLHWIKFIAKTLKITADSGRFPFKKN